MHARSQSRNCGIGNEGSLGTRATTRMTMNAIPAAHDATLTKLELRRQVRSQSRNCGIGNEGNGCRERRQRYVVMLGGGPAKLELRRQVRSQAGAWERGRRGQPARLITARAAEGPVKNQRMRHQRRSARTRRSATTMMAATGATLRWRERVGFDNERKRFGFLAPNERLSRSFWGRSFGATMAW